MSTPRFRVERITPHHRVLSFRSDNTAIDTFLWKDALREDEEELSRTYLLTDAAAANSADAIAGFFTLRAEAQWTTGLPNEETPRNIPVAELAYLARHKRLRGQNIGDELLYQAFRITIAAANQIGIAGIYLAATSEGVMLYQRHGFMLYDVGNKRMFLPIRTIRMVITVVEADTL